MKTLITESRNKNTKDIDIVSTIDMVKMINREDEIVTKAIKSEISNIAMAIDLISDAFLNNGKLYYFGAGTSGRLGVLDASECPPTFGVNNDMVVGIIAGGDRALRYAIEGAEDDYELGKNDGKVLKSADVCVLISASGNPKYLLGVADSAKENNAKIVALTCNRKAKIINCADISICPEVGPEVITGSSRLKAGTAQKLVLNMLSTGAMVKIGKTYENYMIDVKPTNEKLRNRAVNIVKELASISEQEAKDALNKSEWRVKVAVLMSKNNISVYEAEKLLENNNGILRKIIS